MSTITVTFGGTHILYDRDNKICIVVVNNPEQFPDAVATVRTLKADRIFVIGSVELSAEFESLLNPKDKVLYEFDR